MQLTSATVYPLVYFLLGGRKKQFHTFNPYAGAAHALHIGSAKFNLEKVGVSLKKNKTKRPPSHHQTNKQKNNQKNPLQQAPLEATKVTTLISH